MSTPRPREHYLPLPPDAVEPEPVELGSLLGPRVLDALEHHDQAQAALRRLSPKDIGDAGRRRAATHRTCRDEAALTLARRLGDLFVTGGRDRDALHRQLGAELCGALVS